MIKLIYQELDTHNEGMVDIVISEAEDSLDKAITYLQTK